jgi:hypothetical protein
VIPFGLGMPASIGDLATFAKLRSRRKPITERALETAARGGHLAVVQQLVGLGRALNYARAGASRRRKSPGNRSATSRLGCFA